MNSKYEDRIKVLQHEQEVLKLKIKLLEADIELRGHEIRALYAKEDEDMRDRIVRKGE